MYAVLVAQGGLVDKNWLFFAGITLILLFAYRDHKREVRRRNARARFKERKPVPHDELYDLYYAGTDFPKSTVMTVFNGFSTAAGIEVGLLRPEDTLDDLGSAAGISPGVFLIEIAAALRKLKNEVGTDESAGEIKTINEYVKVAAMLERHRYQP